MKSYTLSNDQARKLARKFKTAPGPHDRKSLGKQNFSIQIGSLVVRIITIAIGMICIAAGIVILYGYEIIGIAIVIMLSGLIAVAAGIYGRRKPFHAWIKECGKITGDIIIDQIIDEL